MTGTSGFIGEHIALALVETGLSVVGVDRRPARPRLGGRVQTIEDGCDASAVLDAVAAGAFRGVVHQAAISNTLERDRRRLAAENVEASLALARACARGDATFLYASSFSVYGHVPDGSQVREDAGPGECSGPLNPYAESKLALDRAMAEEFATGLRWAGLRYTNAFGVHEWQAGRASSILSQLAVSAARGEVLKVFSDTLSASRDYVPVDRIAQVVRGLLDAPFPSGVLNVGAGCAVSFATLLGWCAEAVGGTLDVRLVPNPIPAQYQYWTCADVSRLATVLPGVGPLGPGDVERGLVEIVERVHSGG